MYPTGDCFMNFGQDAGTVTFNGVTASQINWTNKKIRVTVPATAPIFRRGSRPLIYKMACSSGRFPLNFQ